MTHLGDIKIEDLWAGAIGVTPVDRSWEGWPETFEFYEAPDCQKCGEYGTWDEEENQWSCPTVDCPMYEGEIEVEDVSGPMMNYSYAVPYWDQAPQVAASRISHLPLCVVEFPDASSIHLALTGGGMDLSWEICEAFILLGFLPPAHFADLPAMSGYPRDDDHRKVMDACLASLSVQNERSSSALQSVRERFARMTTTTEVH